MARSLESPVAEPLGDLTGDDCPPVAHAAGQASGNDQVASGSQALAWPGLSCPEAARQPTRSKGKGEPACRPGSVTTLSVTWQYSMECWLTCGFTSHGFSSVPVPFQVLTEQRRNCSIPGPVGLLAHSNRSWRDGAAQARPGRRRA